MISSLKGTISAIGASSLEIDVGGVGYSVTASPDFLSTLKVGKQMQVVTQMVVREDSMTLYGFGDIAARDVFVALMTVNGVGPKLAQAIAGVIKPGDFARVVASGDIVSLKEVPGVGRRTAERICLDLKDRFGLVEGPLHSTKIANVREALAGLGYTPAEVRETLDKVFDEDQEVEVSVKAALKELSRV